MKLVEKKERRVWKRSWFTYNKESLLVKLSNEDWNIRRQNYDVGKN